MGMTNQSNWIQKIHLGARVRGAGVEIDSNHVLITVANLLAMIIAP
jgi:hypothetical protein